MKMEWLFYAKLEARNEIHASDQDKMYGILVELVGCQDNLFRCLKGSVFVELLKGHETREIY